MIDVIVTIILVLIIGIALLSIRKAKKRGVKCVGCPSGGECSGDCKDHVDVNCKR